MKSCVAGILGVAAAVVLCSTPCFAEGGWIVDLTPGALLASTESSEFHLRGQGEEEEMTLISTIPSVSGGWRFENPNGYVDVKGGAGLLLNARLGAYMFQAVAEGLMEVKHSMMVGPHAGLVYCAAPEWWGDGDIDLDDAIGWMAGVSVVMGDRISYVLSMDYYNLAFDISRVGDGWKPSDEDEIDMSGLAVQFGLRLQF